MRAKAAFLCIVVCLVGVASPGRSQTVALRQLGPDAGLQVRMEDTGEVSLSAWSANGQHNLDSSLAGVLTCSSGFQPDSGRPGAILCLHGLRRNGLTLETELNLAPVLREANGAGGVEVWIDLPRVGLTSVSWPMEDLGGGSRLRQDARFATGASPPPLHIRFGFRTGQWSGVCVSLLVLALLLTVAMALLARAGMAGLGRSLLLLATVVWMGVAFAVQAGALVHILLYGSRAASLAALFVEFWPPLFCVAGGIALGGRRSADGPAAATFGEAFRGFAVVPLLLTCIAGAIPAIRAEHWMAAIPWLAATPAFLLGRHAWLRAGSAATVRPLGDCALMQRVTAFANHLGRPRTKVFVSYSPRSTRHAAFALRGRTIFLTAPLVRCLSRREVDAVVAHEMAHFGHSNRSQWSILMIAIVLFETPVNEFFPPTFLAVALALLFPVGVYLAALRGARKREFAADSFAAALTGDPRAMISSLARVMRNNRSSLDMHPVAVWFSSHPSTRQRIHALAGAARLGAAEVEALCTKDDPGEPYELPPQQESGALFTPAWQKVNAGLYGWSVILLSCTAALFVSGLLQRLHANGFPALVAGAALGCLLTKALSAAVMSGRYARLRRKLAAKLGVGGELVGAAFEVAPRVYGGFRFPDAGLLRFEGGLLCYRSERTAIALHPADVLEVDMIAASPSAWFHRQPRVQFRDPGTGDVRGIILHPVSWFSTQGRLLRSIEQWKATVAAPGISSLNGFSPVAGEPFRKPNLAGVVRSFLLPGAVTCGTAAIACGVMGVSWWYAAYAVAVAACAYFFMLLPALLYRSVELPPELPEPVDAH